MQKITIEVKDNYIDNIMRMLDSVKGLMIERIIAEDDEKIESDFINAQVVSMKKTWDNEEDEVWNDL